MECVKSCKGTFEVVNKGVCFLGFNNYIVNISLDEVVFYLVFEAGLYGTLVGSPSVLEPEQHGRVAVGAEGRDEGCLDLVVLFESDLVITRVAIKKGKQLATSS